MLYYMYTNVYSLRHNLLQNCNVIHIDGEGTHTLSHSSRVAQRETQDSSGPMSRLRVLCI